MTDECWVVGLTILESNLQESVLGEGGQAGFYFCLNETKTAQLAQEYPC